MALNGNEILFVQGLDAAGKPAATLEQTTTAAIAALANSEITDIVNTAITTVGNGTLTAAALAGGVITRSGPTGIFTDTTATAAQIYIQVGSITSVSFITRIKNTTAFNQTLTNGSGVTLPASVIIPSNSEGTYLVTVNTSNTATFVHIATGPLTTNALEVVTTLSTVGAGTITAAGIAGGITARTGSQSGTPFIDTTDIADNIIAAQPNAHIGVSWEYTYQNTTNATATVTGGTGVTVSGITTVPAGKTARYLVTYTAADTITMVGFSAGAITPDFLPNIKKCTAQTDSITTVLANVTGLTAQTLVAGATYRFRCVLPGTADGTSGIKYAFKYTTATLTSIEATGIGQTASAIATQHTTTTTDATLLFDQAAVVILVVLEGTMVVNAGGTVALQIGTHTGTTTCSCYLGATMEFVRIA